VVKTNPHCQGQTQCDNAEKRSPVLETEFQSGHESESHLEVKYESEDDRDPVLDSMRRNEAESLGEGRGWGTTEERTVVQTNPHCQGQTQCDNAEIRNPVLETGTQMKNREFQIYIRMFLNYEKFVVSSESQLLQQIQDRWKLTQDQYMFHPKLVVGQSGMSYILRPKVKGGTPDQMIDLRPRFGTRESDTRTSKYCRFWFREKVCDAYLAEWTASQLVRAIRAEHETCLVELKVWIGTDQIEGAFEWDTDHLIVSETPPLIQDCPKLWRWNLIFVGLNDPPIQRLVAPPPPQWQMHCRGRQLNGIQNTILSWN
jgi:hypothetical protein